MKPDANQIETLIKLFYVFLYFLPTWIALIRRPDYPIIWVLNLWLGWTGLGWIIAFVWACYPNKRRARIGVVSLNEQVDLQEFHKQRVKYLDYKLDQEELAYQLRKRRVPAVCNRCGESDPCQCQISEIAMLI